MPYTQEFAIGFALFTFWTATAIMGAGLLRGYIEAPNSGNARYLRHPYNCTPMEAREPFIVMRP
jgi:hypothetical protein